MIMKLNLLLFVRRVFNVWKGEKKKNYEVYVELNSESDYYLL